MRLTPALAYEKLRQDADSMNKLILNKDGKWYHVYEWSAWLLKTSVDDINPHHPQKTWASVCSFMGVLSHYDSYNIRSQMFFNSELLTLGKFDRDMTQYFLR